MQRHNKAIVSWWLPFGLLAVLILYGGYFLVRSDTSELLLVFTFSFLIYTWLSYRRKSVDWPALFWGGLFLRILLLFMIPNLSDDIYRFIWDGQLTWNVVHPFAHIPAWYFENGFPDYLDPALYDRLNSPGYFTVYPPVSQFFFMMTAAVTQGDPFWSSVLLRVFLIAAETGTFFLLREICSQSGMDPRRTAWYWLNPLVLLEITGNLHFEGFMIFFLFLSLVLLIRQYWWMAGAAFGLAVGVKLLPLIFLPVIWKHIGWRSFRVFVLMTGSVLLIYTLPFLDMAFIYGLQDSLALYFQKFEFNASIYYLVREFGYWYKGYNIIETAGPRLAMVTFLLISLFALRHSPLKVRLSSAMGISLTLYLLLATTVHPWYLLVLIPLFLLQDIYFPVLWSALVVLSYAGYTPDGYTENLWLTFVEYALVIVYMIYELVYQKRMHYNPFYRIPVG